MGGNAGKSGLFNKLQPLFGGVVSEDTNHGWGVSS